MKKLLVIFLALILVFSFIGCGGKKDNKLPSSRYTYEWSPSAASGASAVFSTLDLSASYTSPIIPPYCAVSIVDGGAKMMSVITTYSEITEYANGEQIINKVPVSSDFSCEDTDGSFTVDAGESTVFVPKRLGLLNIKATWNGNNLNIPVKIYHFAILHGSLGPETAFDFDTMTASYDNLSPDTDLYFNSYGFQTPHGCEIVTNTYSSPLISSILTAPTGTYSLTNAGYPTFSHDTLVLKTSNGKYVKLIQSWSGDSGRGLIFFVSDSSGVFEY